MLAEVAERDALGKRTLAPAPGSPRTARTWPPWPRPRSAPPGSRRCRRSRRRRAGPRRCAPHPDTDRRRRRPVVGGQAALRASRRPRTAASRAVGRRRRRSRPRCRPRPRRLGDRAPDDGGVLVEERRVPIARAPASSRVEPSMSVNRNVTVPVGQRRPWVTCNVPQRLGGLRATLLGSTGYAMRPTVDVDERGDERAARKQERRDLRRRRPRRRGGGPRVRPRGREGLPRRADAGAARPRRRGDRRGRRRGGDGQSSTPSTRAKWTDTPTRSSLRAGALDMSFNAIGHGDVHGPPLMRYAVRGLRPARSSRAVRSAVPDHPGRGPAHGPAGIGRDHGDHRHHRPQAIPEVGGTGVAFDAIESQCRQWAAELGPHGVRVVWLQHDRAPGGHRRHPAVPRLRHRVEAA